MGKLREFSKSGQIYLDDISILSMLFRIPYYLPQTSLPKNVSIQLKAISFNFRVFFVRKWFMYR